MGPRAMDEISIFKILRPPPPAAAGEITRGVGDRLDQALAQAAATPVSSARVRPARLALAAGLSLALTAGVIAVAVIRPGGSAQVTAHNGTRHAPSAAVRELAYRTAAVAAAQPDVRPGQWVYWKEKQFGGKPDGVFRVWTTADSRRAAYVNDKGKVQYIGVSYCGGGPAASTHRVCTGSIGQPAPFVTPHDTSISEILATIPVSYPGLRLLPRTPRALVAYLSGLRFPHWGPAPAREFTIIKQMLITYVMPPALTAELYQSLALIPGVTIDRHATDIAGRPGLGLSMAVRGVLDELVINPRTFKLAGQQLVTGPQAGPVSRVISGTAILQRSFVSGPGLPP
jgi:hypothetical protein